MNWAFSNPHIKMCAMSIETLCSQEHVILNVASRVLVNKQHYIYYFLSILCILYVFVCFFHKILGPPLSFWVMCWLMCKDMRIYKIVIYGSGWCNKDSIYTCCSILWVFFFLCIWIHKVVTCISSMLKCTWTFTANWYYFVWCSVFHLESDNYFSSMACLLLEVHFSKWQQD